MILNGKNGRANLFSRPFIYLFEYFLVKKLFSIYGIAIQGIG